LLPSAVASLAIRRGPFPTKQLVIDIEFWKTQTRAGEISHYPSKTQLFHVFPTRERAQRASPQFGDSPEAGFRRAPELLGTDAVFSGL